MFIGDTGPLPPAVTPPDHEHSSNFLHRRVSQNKRNKKCTGCPKTNATKKCTRCPKTNATKKCTGCPKTGVLKKTEHAQIKYPGPYHLPSCIFFVLTSQNTRTVRTPKHFKQEVTFLPVCKHCRHGSTIPSGAVMFSWCEPLGAALATSTPWCQTTPPPPPTPTPPF